MAARRLREGELSLWFETMRGVRPLRPGATPKPPEATPAKSPGSGPKTTKPEPPPLLTRVPPPKTRGADPFPAIGERQAGLDDTSWRMLGDGRMRPQRRLDLHGRHAEAAFRLLHGFLLRAHADRVRCVEIITGAGSGPEGGILRRELPHWLARADLRPLVLAAVHPHARNVGSVRLLLRRRSL